MKLSATLCILVLAVVIGCRSRDDGSNSASVGITGGPVAPAAKAPSLLVTTTLRAFYKESGFAGPQVSLYDAKDQAAVSAGRTLGISNCSTKADIATCDSGGWVLTLSKSGKRAQITSTSQQLNKTLTCKSVSVGGMTPSTGYDCTQDATTGAPVVATTAPTGAAATAALISQDIRAIYKNSGIAGPRVSLYDAQDAGAVNAGRTLDISSNCVVKSTKIKCVRGDWSFILSTKDKTATLQSGDLSLDKSMTCATINVSGMTPSIGYDCTQD